VGFENKVNQRISWGYNAVISTGITYFLTYSMGMIIGYLTYSRPQIYNAILSGSLAYIIDFIVGFTVFLIVLETNHFENESYGHKIFWTTVTLVFTLPIIIAGAFYKLRDIF